MKNTTAIGNKAEEQAAKFLEQAGYEILERNSRNRFSELDIIAHNKDYICFVEVKYRNTGSFGGGLGAITADKRRRLSNAAEYWLAHHPDYASLQPRIDVVAVDQAGELELLENVTG